MYYLRMTTFIGNSPIESLPLWEDNKETKEECIRLLQNMAFDAIEAKIKKVSLNLENLTLTKELDDEIIKFRYSEDFIAL